MLELLVLAGAGAIGGALNSVAGGGSFVVFPTLVVSGIPEIAANATTTVGLWPAGAASVVAYRRDLPTDKTLVVVLSLASLVGGLCGALLLLGTSDAVFALVLPWLIGFAALLFTLGPRLQRALGEREAGSRRALALGALVQIAIATYGGYFGGGMGILMLATFSMIGVGSMHAMNGLKNWLGVVLNGVAIVAFVVAHEVRLVPACAVAVGGVLGGYGGAALARRVPAARVRVAVVVYAWAMTAYFAWRAYGR